MTEVLLPYARLYSRKPRRQRVFLILCLICIVLLLVWFYFGVVLIRSYACCMNCGFIAEGIVLRSGRLETSRFMPVYTDADPTWNSSVSSAKQRCKHSQWLTESARPGARDVLKAGWIIKSRYKRSRDYPLQSENGPSGFSVGGN